MQVYVEIILVAILVVILFNGSITGLKEFANSVLGKAVMVCLIIFISHQFGTNAGGSRVLRSPEAENSACAMWLAFAKASGGRTGFGN